MRRGCVNVNHIVFLCWEMISWKRRCSKFLQLHIGANVTGSTFELGISPGFQVSLLFVSFGHTLVPEQSCPFCSYSLTLEHLTLGCEFVDAAVCCESVVSYGWEYFLQPSMELGSWELRFFMSSRALLRSSLHYNKDAGCSNVFPPSNLLRFSIPWRYWNLIALPLRPTVAQVGGMPRGTYLFVPFGPPAQGAT